MNRLLNRATPATAATVGVPSSVPPPGFRPSASETWSVAVVTVFPNASVIATSIAGENGAPAVVLLGCVLNWSWEDGAATMLNGALVAPVSDPDAAVSE